MTDRKSFQKAYKLQAYGKNLLKAQATVGGRKEGDFLRVRLLVDTGSTYTILPTLVVETLGYDIRNPIRIEELFTGQGKIDVPVINVCYFNCVGQFIENFEVAAYNIPATIGLDGLLGMDFLLRCQAVISIANGEIICRQI